MGLLARVKRRLQPDDPELVIHACQCGHVFVIEIATADVDEVAQEFADHADVCVVMAATTILARDNI